MLQNQEEIFDKTEYDNNYVFNIYCHGQFNQNNEF